MKCKMIIKTERNDFQISQTRILLTIIHKKHIRCLRKIWAKNIMVNWQYVSCMTGFKKVKVKNCSDKLTKFEIVLGKNGHHILWTREKRGSGQFLNEKGEAAQL